MPVLNEEAALGRCLGALKTLGPYETIIVDGGSEDATVSRARELGAKVVPGRRGRAAQMNLGASAASGDVLLFLHADCVLPPEAFGLISEAFQSDAVVAGAFDIAIEAPGAGFRLIEFVANLRSRTMRIIYGDQGMFVRAGVFRDMGGFADLPLMEDLEISSRLGRAGKIVFMRPPVTTLPRRWKNEGLLYTTLRDWGIAFAYTVLGVRPERLAKYYGDVR